jgi:hypothetical protein
MPFLRLLFCLLLAHYSVFGTVVEPAFNGFFPESKTVSNVVLVSENASVSTATSFFTPKEPIHNKITSTNSSVFERSSSPNSTSVFNSGSLAEELIVSESYLLSANSLLSEIGEVSKNSEVSENGLEDNLISAVPLYKKLLFLKKRSLTHKIFNEDIPDSMAEYFELSAPLHQQVLIQPDLIIKGKNAYSSYTFVNTDRIRNRKDGEFYYEDQLESIGPQPVYLTFITPQNKFLSLKRTCIRLISPPDFKLVKENRKTIIYFYNSRFFYDRNGEKILKKSLTRAELAYFVYQLVNQGTYRSSFSYFDDVQNDKWYADAVNFCAEYGYMKGFIDGHFNPASAVTNIDYILTLSKLVLEDQQEEDHVMDTISSDHWIMPNINTLISHQLLLPNPSLDLYREIQLIDFINLVSHLPQVISEFQKLDHVSEFESHDSLDIKMIDFIYEFMIQRDKAIETLRGISFDEFKDKSYVFQNELTLSGVIFPIESFKVNDVIVYPDIQGEFLATLNIEEGLSTVTVDALDEITEYKVYRLKGYENLEGHWFSKTAAKLRYLSLLPNTPTYDSDDTILKEELASLLYRLSEMNIGSEDTFSEELLSTENISTQDIVFEDVLETSPYITAIDYVVGHNIARIENGFFYPKKEVLRSEAITMLIRSFYMDGDEDDIELPFWDVQKNHWAYESIQKAYILNLISPSPHFYPDKPITKAEFLTMISRVEKIQVLFKVTFDND